MRKTEWSKRQGKPKKTSIVVPENLWISLKARAVHGRRNVQELVAEAIEDYLRKKGGRDAR
jgi:hypothetical protein